jgi:organic radical activating enzyme
VTEHYLCAEGEGATLGAATYLIRLSGCDLRCWWCDSKFSSFREDEAQELDPGQLQAAALASGAAWVSFTGGEPTWRGPAELKALAALAGRLRARGLKVKVESNGRRLPPALKACVDLWSVAPKWSWRSSAGSGQALLKGSQAASPRGPAMDYDPAALGRLARAYAPDRLQLKFVITWRQGAPEPRDLATAAAIVKALPKLKARPPLFFIPEAYAAGDYLQRVRDLEAAVLPLGRGALQGWDLRVQPQWHRVLHGDARRR